MTLIEQIRPPATGNTSRVLRVGHGPAADAGREGGGRDGERVRGAEGGARSTDMRLGTAYRADIDGLRAIAVLSVVAFHCSAAWLRGGFIGVDIFFVISGYLITSIMLKDQWPVSIRAFYANRVRRIAPALYVMLATVLTVSAVVLLPGALAGLGSETASAGAFVSNVYFWREIDYFNVNAHSRPLLHTWSLGVEWQFYIVFPIAMNIAKKYRLPIKWCLVAAAAVSVGISVWQARFLPQAGYYLPFARAFELLIGGLVAAKVVGGAVSPRLAQMLTALGLATVIGSLLLINEKMPFPGWIALIPCIATACLIQYGTVDGPVGRMLSARPLVFIGRISYSIYLWHWPVIVFARYLAIRELTPPQAFACGASSIVLGYLSWRFVEEPFRRRRTPVMRTLGEAGLVAGGLAAAGLALLATHGLPGRFDARIDAIQAQASDTGSFRKCLDKAPSSGNDLSHLCRLGAAAAPVSFIVWGDSKGAAAAAGISAEADRRHLAGVFIGTHSCLPLFDQPGTWLVSKERCRVLIGHMRDLLAASGVRRVILAGRWATLDDAGVARVAPTLAWLQAHGFRTTVMLDVPGAKQPVPTALARKLAFRSDVPIDYTVAELRARDGARNDALRAAAARSGADVLDPAPLFCSSGTCRSDDHLRPLYFDEGHLNDFGSGIVARAFAAQLFP